MIEEQVKILSKLAIEKCDGYLSKRDKEILKHLVEESKNLREVTNVLVVALYFSRNKILGSYIQSNMNNK